MGAGPFLSYDDDGDLERHLANIRSRGIRTAELPLTGGPSVGRREFRFQRGFGAVHGFTSGKQDDRWIYLGCDHTFNPFLWWPDSCLLSELKSIMVAAGSRISDP
jgi:hypothetical protein